MDPLDGWMDRLKWNDEKIIFFQDRVGSEFWKQVEQIGNDETGIMTTLSQTERGYPPPIEHIGKPIFIKNEMGE